MTDPEEIIVVDDRPEHLEICEEILTAAGYRCITYDDPHKALDRINREPPCLAIVDMKMPAMDGIEFLKQVNGNHPNLPIIMLSAFTTIERTVDAIKNGAFDFLDKPFRPIELTKRVQRALLRHQSAPIRHVNPNQSEETIGRYNLLGNSPAMKAVHDRIQAVAPYDANVFVYGETGTGKELVAEAIVNLSKRRDDPFITIDCAAISESLIDSEIFGHEKGAYTGAHSQQKGLIESANGGTVFLDEITELNPELQSKFLRVLEQGHFRRVGGRALIDVDIRVIAATNQNPWEAIRAKNLREDLFYRLNGITINLPPLRNRLDDLDLLIAYFLRRIAHRHSESVKSMTSDVMSNLKEYRWPGNVRELYNLAEQLHMMAGGETIVIDDLPDYVRENHSSSKGDDFYCLPYKDALERFTCEFRDTYFSNLLSRNHQQISRAARDAGVDRATIYRWMKKR